MNLPRLVATFALCALALGCTKKLGPPSKEYAEARNAYFQLLADNPSGAYGDPKIKGLLAKIESVPADSIDAEAAKNLAATIRTGIADYEKAEASKQSAVASANSAPAPVPSFPTPSAAAPAPAPAPAAAAVDGGPAPVAVTGPSTGMPETEFKSKFGECFTKAAAYTDTSGAAGEAYALNNGYNCGKYTSGFGSSVVLVSGGKVAGVVPRSAVVNEQTFTVTQGTKTVGGQQAPAPAQPAPVVGPAPVPTAAPVLPQPDNSQITQPSADPNANSNSVNR